MVVFYSTILTRYFVKTANFKYGEKYTYSKD